MKTLISIFKLYALVASLCTSAHATPATIVKGDVFDGFDNNLVNSSFEFGTYNSGWTATTVTPAKETTIIKDGKQSIKLPYSFTTGGISQSVVPTVQTAGVPYETSCWVYDTSGGMEVCGLAGGVKQNCNLVPPTTSWQLVTTNFPGPANGTSVGAIVDATGTKSGNAYVDKCYTGPARNVTSAPLATNWSTTYTFTPSAAFGTATSADWRSRQVGDHIEVEGYFISGTLAASQPLLTLPAGLTIDTTKLRSTTQATSVGMYWCSVSGAASSFSTNGNLGAIFYDGTTSNQIFLTPSGSTSAFSKTGTAVGNFCGNTGGFSVRFSFPVTGWTANGSAFRADATPANWSGNQSASWTTTNTSVGDFGTATGTITQSNAINVSAPTQISGSLPGYTFTLPRTGNWDFCWTALVADSAINTMNLQLTDASNVAIGPLVSTQESTANNVLAAQNCWEYNATSTTVNFKLRGYSGSAGTLTLSNFYIKVFEKSAPMPAPYLTGSVTSSSATQGFHHEFWNQYSTCTAGSCTATNQSGGFTTISNTSHVYTATFNAAVFSGPPSCTFTSGGGTAIPAFNIYPTSTSMQFAFFVSGVATDEGFTVDCFGPR